MNIIELAKEAGLEQVVAIDPKNGTRLVKSLPPELLERFAALVRVEALAEQKELPVGSTASDGVRAPEDYSPQQVEALQIAHREDCGGNKFDCAGCEAAYWRYRATVKESLTVGNQQLTTAEPVKQSQQADASLEPVVWLVQHKNRHEFVWGNKPEFIVDGIVEPLYAAPVQPVKQEPEWYHSIDKFGCNHFYSNDEVRPTESKPLYAAPVSCATSCPDAKAIKAKALEEAFLVCQQVSLRYLDHYGPDECAAAIKRLK